MKSEPSVYSIADLKKEKKAMWDGVRNHQARNLMRDDMADGDLVLFYHSSTDPSGVAGIGRICGDVYPDPTQFDPKSHYFDPKSKPTDPTWLLRDVAWVETLDDVVTLQTMKQDPKLDGMMVIKRGMRLSVQPVDKKHFQRVLQLAKAKTKP
jgi:predicted RNA-binding protein with PUA-like domain